MLMRGFAFALVIVELIMHVYETNSNDLFLIDTLGMLIKDMEISSRFFFVS